MRAKHADWFAGLDQQSLVRLECTQGIDDAVEAFPVARGAPDAAIYDQLIGILGHFRIQVVHQHP